MMKWIAIPALLAVTSLHLCSAGANGQTPPPIASPALPSRGPIEYPGLNVVTDAQGVYAPAYRFENRTAKPTPWQAKWMWIAGNTKGDAVFRKQITLAEAPRNVSAWITADSKYRLWINGRLVSRGPVDMGRDYTGGGSTHRWFYDFRDLTPYFKKGRNVIAAEVFPNFHNAITRGAPGLLFEAQVDAVTVKSDSTWQGAPRPSEAGWEQPEFDDAAWKPTREVKNIWEPLIASEIPPLMEARYPVAKIEGLPSNKTFEKEGGFRVVFDRVLSGYPQLKLKGGKGAKVTIKAHRSNTFVLGGGEETLEFPFMTEIDPGFTVELTQVTSPVEVLDVGAVFTSQPVDYRGSFECSDERLNRLWPVSRWAVQICLQTHHLDSPNHQEPISDPGDYVIESMVNNYAFAQPWLARQDIRKFAWILKDKNYNNFHTSYSIAWLQWLMDYYDFTGDKALVDEMAPYVHELLETYSSWRGKNGILSEAPNYMFMDWVHIGGFPCHHPPAVIGQGYLTAFYHDNAFSAQVPRPRYPIDRGDSIIFGIFYDELA